MFANYYEKAPFLQVTVFSHQGRLRFGIHVGKMKINATTLMGLVDSKLNEMIRSK
jgi:hypothetical protein